MDGFGVEIGVVAKVDRHEQCVLIENEHSCS